MRTLKCSIVIALLILGLAACTNKESTEHVTESKPKLVADTSMPSEASQPQALDKQGANEEKAQAWTDKKLGQEAARIPAEERLTMADAKIDATLQLEAKTLRLQDMQGTASSAASNLDGNPETLAQHIDAYLNSLKSAAYAFNPPSPIVVAEPVTIHLWLDPQATAAGLAEELKKAVPRDAARVESGQTRWSPKMRATLSGPDFEVKPIDSEEQPVSSTQRTTWSWDIIPQRPGKNLALHIRLEAVLPPELGPPKTITTLDREITVEVTWWWLFDHYYDKYWKELLAGLGTLLASALAWWWKNRHAANQRAE